ncbi:carboxylesterase/lipase family protein [Neobacillus sp. 3P2-tot-E-2]|uniref:carboxylesterase/lipase family protein n=1 Tax=Neobacillus sp. 3P2-tot-E-2 TaxID=3132212 RepID=UPI0039A21B0B
MLDPIVETVAGKVRGTNDEGVYTFKGIPYGDTTEGARRFMAPSKPQPWVGVRDAIAFGSRCYQTEGGIQEFDRELKKANAWDDGPEDESENCLVLNVWTRGITDGKKRPVMFWCHGGGFFAGSGARARNNGKFLAKRGDVVVVTVNHRLGPLGFLHLGDLAGEEYAASGNAGMLDLVLALEWVRDNIEQFGGDPGNVTIFGTSGGGGKVSTLLAMPSAQGLFHRAAIQSSSGLRMRTREEATQLAETLLFELGLGVDQLDKLHQLHPKQIWEAYWAATKWSPESFAKKGRNVMAAPVVDGRYLPNHPCDPVAPSISAHVPLMTGTTKDEATLFLLSDPQLGSIDEQGMMKWLNLYAGDDSERVLNAYRSAMPDASPNDLLVAMVTDRLTRMGSITLAERKLALKSAPVYMYMFSWESPILGGKMKSFHGADAPFIFDTLSLAPTALTGDDPELVPLANKMSEAWIAFATYGNPNHPGLPEWPAYSLEERATMTFDKECRMVKDPLREGRLAWELVKR